MLEVAVTKTTPKREKQNADVGGALACVQAGAHVSAHAQHTNAPVQDAPVQDAPVQRIYCVWVGTWDRRHVLHAMRTKAYTHEELVRLVADKRAKGYALCRISRYFGTYNVVFKHESYIADAIGCTYIGHSAMEHKAGRVLTEYAPVQEARE